MNSLSSASLELGFLHWHGVPACPYILPPCLLPEIKSEWWLNDRWFFNTYIYIHFVLHFFDSLLITLIKTLLKFLAVKCNPFLIYCNKECFLIFGNSFYYAINIIPTIHPYFDTGTINKIFIWTLSTI